MLNRIRKRLFGRNVYSANSSSAVAKLNVSFFNSIVASSEIHHRVCEVDKKDHVLG